MQICVQSIDDALAMRSLIDGLHSRYNRAVVEQAAIAGALNPEIFNDLGQANAMAEKIASRLDAVAEETERGWQGRTSPSNDGPGGFIFERMVRGVKEYAGLDMALLGSADARELDRYAARLGEVYASSAGSAAQGAA